MNSHEHIRTIAVLGHEVTVDDAVGKLCVAHDGTMSWDRLHEIKTIVWGPDACAIEIYPRLGDVVNNGNYRHLWRLGDHDFCPDLLGFTALPVVQRHTLEGRCFKVWSEARRAFA